MNVYPALRARMGTWDYYMVKMSMKELAAEVHFAAEIYTDRTLDEAVQRVLNEGRAKKEIVRYLAGTDERFFASIVIAAMDGNPAFHPIEIPGYLSHLSESVGALSFDGKQKYYALDGQHRLKAIKTLLDPSEPASAKAPPGFSNEECSVLVIVKPSSQDTPSFLKSYRRLFSNLNRYAKATDEDTNIILDEDDTFAILTRRLISEFPFFQWAGRQMESARIKTKGKNFREGESFFTSLQTLYVMTEVLLETSDRSTKGWGTENETRSNFVRFRPEDSVLDSYFAELCSVWELILDELPILKEEPSKMRVHSQDWWDTPAAGQSDTSPAGESDHLLFWPIGQELLARVVRRLLDYAERNDIPINQALKGLSSIEWRLHAPPWRNLLLTPPTSESKGSKKWTIRSEDRKEAVNLAQVIINWMLVPEFMPDEELRIHWSETLYPRLDDDDEETNWTHILSVRDRVQERRTQS